MEKSRNIFEILKKEHGIVRSLIEQAQESTPKQRQAILEKIEANLVPHARGEERTLYAYLHEKAQEREFEDALNLADEAYEEHKAADDILEELKELNITDEGWLAKLEEFKDNVEHHMEEEENRLFPMAEEVLDKEILQWIEKVYLDAKEQYKRTLPSQDQISSHTPL